VEEKYFKIGMVSAIMTSLGFLIGVKWGAIGGAFAYAIVTYVGLVPILKWAFKETSLELSDFFSNISRPLVASLLAAIFVYFVKLSISGYPLILTLFTLGVLFLGSYVIFISLSKAGRSDLIWVWGQCRSLFRKRS